MFSPSLSAELNPVETGLLFRRLVVTCLKNVALDSDLQSPTHRFSALNIGWKQGWVWGGNSAMPGVRSATRLARWPAAVLKTDYSSRTPERERIESLRENIGFQNTSFQTNLCFLTFSRLILFWRVAVHSGQPYAGWHPLEGTQRLVSQRESCDFF